MIDEIIDYNTRIEELDLTVKTYNCLKRAKINTLADFKERIHSKKELLKIRNLGTTNMREILGKLIDNNIIEITESGELKYISEEELFQSKYEYKSIKEINEESEDYKKSIVKKFERLLELEILLNEKFKLVQIDKQLDEETILLMGRIDCNEESKPKIKIKK